MHTRQSPPRPHNGLAPGTWQNERARANSHVGHLHLCDWPSGAAKRTAASEAVVLGLLVGVGGSGGRGAVMSANPRRKSKWP